MPARTSLFALALFYSSFLLSQEIDFQSTLDSTAESLILLDVKASDCLDALDTGENRVALCDDFMAAIDGEIVANYLAQCRLLKGWRDEYVEQTIEANLANDSQDDEETLRRLVAVEYYCADTTVLQRTEFVAAAFNRLGNNSANDPSGTHSSSASLRQQLSENRFNFLENQERMRLQDALRSEQNRSQRETERQFDNLENELIRQQIRNTNRPNQ